jgi:sugar fermentation stimulation protein A
VRMLFKNELLPAILIKRYKRFLADVILDDGTKMTVYCPNTGSMTSCSAPGSKVLLSRSANEKRKYPYSLEMVRAGNTWVGVNTGLTNRIVVEAIEQGKIKELDRVDSIKTEVKVSAGSRLDVMVEAAGKKTYIEIKNCSMVVDKIAMFPDAVTARGTKHLYELAKLVMQGHGGIIFYLVQRGDAEIFKPAAQVDPVYVNALKEVVSKGVEVLAYQAKVGPSGIAVECSLPFSLT